MAFHKTHGSKKKDTRVSVGQSTTFGTRAFGYDLQQLE